MSFETALRFCEIGLSIALLQSALEHVWSGIARAFMLVRLCLAALLMTGFGSEWACLLLLGHGIALLFRFDGPYNGGADRMAMLILICLTAAHWLPVGQGQELALGYLAVQLALSYAISGWVKISNPDWRSGRALCDVFEFSAYPVSEDLRGFGSRRWLMFAMSWAVIIFELVFPLGLLNAGALYLLLAVAAAFHFANSLLFGLNRFFWAWLAAYPSIIWFQGRIMG